MKIKLHFNYGGVRTNEQRILPGIYDSTDHRLFDIADYLVESGHASVVNEDVPVSVFVPEQAPVEDLTFHNELMKKKGRPIIDPPTIEDVSIEDITRAALLADYERIYGRPAPKNITDDTLQHRVENPPNDDTPNADD